MHVTTEASEGLGGIGSAQMRVWESFKGEPVGDPACHVGMRENGVGCIDEAGPVKRTRTAWIWRLQNK